MKRLITLALFAAGCLSAFPQLLPSATREARPGVRWWWFGSAVDKKYLAWNLEQYAKAGIGTVEITPIYGVQGNEKNEIAYLSPEWMEMLRFTEEESDRLGIETDMTTGTGWPFGGPWVPLEEAACKAVFADTVVCAGTKVEDIKFCIPAKERPYSVFKLAKAFPIEGYAGKKRVVALYEGRTRMKVKRPAPGGEGYVIDHFDSTAVCHYLQHIDSAFTASKTPFPHTFFNDSYEVYGADWTPSLLEEFEKRRGYKLEDVLDKLMDRDPQVVSDYRETLGDLLLNNFTRQWTAWAHRHGAITRNQAHGSPANLIDCYGAVDIPEIEGFGLTDFGIKGLRKDPGMTRPNFSDLSMLKYASSAAHISGKKYTSSETFTWLTEHFRTSLSQMKPDLDLMFCAGVNHMFFHGTAYSPEDEAWPGWKFYASVDMSPTNSIWRDAPSLMSYITNCQTYLQWGAPDNDFLVYLPVRDMWRKNRDKLLMQFDIHSMKEKAPEFIRAILDIDRAGFDCDYISDRYLLSAEYKDGHIITAEGTRYKGLIIPGGNLMPEEVKQHLSDMKEKGAHITNGIDAAWMANAATPESAKTRLSLKLIRRSNPIGHHYFMANLTGQDICTPVKLATGETHAVWYNPMTNSYNRADVYNDGVMINLRSGESRILIASALPTTEWGVADSIALAPYEKHTGDSSRRIDLTQGKWKLSFENDHPKVGKAYKLDRLQTWESLGDSAAVTMGTGVYRTSFRMSGEDAARSWTIDLGDVRESARVYINNVYVGCAWAAPFVLDCKNALRKGKNTLRIEVTNLPANRIADMDRRGVKWRKMKEINVVDINYKKTTYGNWAEVESGLNSEVTLVSKE